MGFIKERIAHRIQQLHTILTVEGSLRARFKGCYFEMYEMLHSIQANNITFKTIIDVGANRGMFTKVANYIFPDAKIIAFEPLKDCFEELTRLNNSIPSLECFNVALGDAHGEKEIFHSQYDYSSSLLEMEDLHKAAFPYSEKYQKDKIVTARLDDIVDIGNYKKPILMKIDVQGYEDFVIKGAAETLKSIDYLICEMSFEPLYHNQILFPQLYNLITEHGFKFQGPIAINRHPKTKTPLQIDGLFTAI